MVVTMGGLGEVVVMTRFRDDPLAQKSMASGTSPIAASSASAKSPQPSSLLSQSQSLNAFLRGFQLSIVGVYRALQNPDLFTQEHYRQAAYAVAAGLSLYLLLLFPLFLIRASVWTSSLFVDLNKSKWDDDLIDGVNFVEHHVLSLPFLIMTILRHIYPRPLDDLFVQSLEWSDRIYQDKHANDNNSGLQLRPLYSKALALYARNRSTHRMSKFIGRTAKRLAIGFVLYLLSHLPGIGRLVFPAAGFYSLYRALGEDLVLAAVIGGVGLLLFPKRTYVVLVQGWLSTRALTRELLEPYFARIPFSDSQKREWFREREGVLFGFGLAFYLVVRLPLLGPLAYGVAEAATAFLITKISDPPPPPVYVDGFAASQLKWINKSNFLNSSAKDAFSVEYQKQGHEMTEMKKS